ncbi:dihydrodipicolinate synthase family protein [Azospirillum sp. ST 5-10]|uniref:dihydrodipicolinate synthase family protein n=1 Tax=unclassified Azospirillum TaxID=2630922 RepID=UPI003F49D67C
MTTLSNSAVLDMKARLGGFFNITVTPFTAAGDLDTGALAANIERVLEIGADGLLIGGTYGEFPTMTVEERADLFRRVMDQVGARVPVMLCSAGSDVRVVRDLTVLAGELGGVPMITPPYVSEITDEQIVAFFREMAPLSRTGALIYNAPGIGITLSAKLIEQLAAIPEIVAIKQGDLTPTVIDQLVGALHGRIRLFCASDLAFLGPVAAGFDGISSTNSCAFPELILDSYRAMQRGDAITAGALHRLWFPYRQLARRFGQPQTVKAAMAARGWTGGSVRRPLRDLPAAEVATVRAAVAAMAADPRARIGALAA